MSIHITEAIIAGDRASADRWWALAEAGECSWTEAVRLTGSYSRMDQLLRAVEQGKVSEDELPRLMVETWPTADPDDTDPRFLQAWRQVWVANGSRYLRDGVPLPRRSNLTVYRGQRPHEPVGIAWSLDKDVAQRFAQGAGLRARVKGGVVYAGKIERRKVLAYLTQRGEKEVVLDPANLSHGRVEVILP